jgi:hypothetical protein
MVFGGNPIKYKKVKIREITNVKSYNYKKIYIN